MATKRELRMGLREGTGKGKEYSVSPNAYFHRRGGHFVFMHLGLASLCGTANNTKIAGWLESPKDTAGKDSWKSAAGDKAFVVYCADNVFCMPVDETIASVSATTWIGRGSGLDETGATHAMIQRAKLDVKGTIASPLSIVDVDVTNKLVYVKVKPAKIQAI
uniref:Uncharacterized protein n=1 Tax=viral metagenome TaxID=1070528 RepID=A0A6M3K088_9ZZZZ